MTAPPNLAHSRLAPASPGQRERIPLRAIVLALLLLPGPVLAAGAGQQVHGENSVFAGNGVALAWGVLKGATEEATQAVLRIVPAGGPYTYVSVDGVDPFTQKRQEILAGQPLGPHLDVRSSRATFADFPRREIHFYTAEAWRLGQPDLTVYFMGLPDTSPEFTSEPALSAYLSDALTKVTGGR
ncbi:MAG TPA: hypothetical protein VLM91_02135 [Candidatus Methylomirabilis sp.]|nr:hypothetical protein [Candidatus Methylomirabilis sp.]